MWGKVDTFGKRGRSARITGSRDCWTGVMGVLVAAVVIFNILAPVRCDFLSSCPALCQCKWSGGKKTADCSNKAYTTIPPNIHTDVQVLNMDGNYIKELSKDSFSSVGLYHLQKISLKDCKIQKIHENAFSKLKILTEINLDGNNITKLPSKLFDGNERLRTIILSSNQISSLIPHQFPPLRALKKIDLSNTGLRTINMKAFMNLGRSVEDIDLHGNYLQNIREETFITLQGLKHLQLHENPWMCDCKLKNFRDFVVHKKLLTSETICLEPERLADKAWTQVNSQDFACKPEVEVSRPKVLGKLGENATLECKIIGNPVPAVKWVLNGRIIQNNTSPLHTKNMEQTYVISEKALAEGGIERNLSLTITNVKSNDLGDYSCVAINKGGMAERNVTLTFTDPLSGPVPYPQKLTIIIGVAAGALLILIVFVIALCCCCCRKRGKDKSGHSLNGSVLGYTDPAGEKLLPPNGTLNRANPLPKPHRTGEYGMVSQSDQEMLDYGPASYVPGDRYDEYGEGRTSASNSDQTGTLSRASYHSSDPDQYPDLLDIPNRYKQPSPTSTSSTLYDTTRLPHHPNHNHGHHGHQHQQPLHPAHLMSPPHLHHHHASPFQRTGTLPHNFTSGTLPHNHHPRSVSCDHSSGYVPVQTTHQQRPGYVTLPRRPRASWAGQQPPAQARDTPSPAFSLRDPIYDGVGPRTSADGSSSINLNKSMDSTTPRGQNGAPGSRFPMQVTATLPPYCAPIKEECPQTPKHQQTKMGQLPNSSPNILDIPERVVNKRSPITALMPSGSDQTLNEENLSAYFEPFGSALAPIPGQRDSIASCESDSLLIADKKDNNTDAEKDASSLCSTPKLNNSNPTPSPAPNQLDTIPEMDNLPSVKTYSKKLPPPTLPKPNKKPSKSGPAPPPKPKKKTDSFQDETCDGSEV